MMTQSPSYSPKGSAAESAAPIVIDARMVDVTKLHGIARYSLELVRHINEIHLEQLREGRRPELSFIVLVSPKFFQDFADELGELADTVRLVICDIKWLTIPEMWRLRGTLKEYKAALFHSTSFVRPLAAPCPVINTLHDLNHVDLAENYSLQKRLYYALIVKPLVASADYILTVSEFSKARLVDWLEVASDKVVVTYNGIADSFFAPQGDDGEALAQLRQRYNLPDGPYWLGVAHDKAHKNTLTTIRAYRLAETDAPLVLLGARHRLGEREQRSLGDLPAGKQVIFTGAIADPDLPAVYQLARLFIFPSYYEGFGLPPLEALAAGTPSVVASIPAFEEVLGGRAVFASPHDPEAVGKAAAKLAEDEVLRQRILANRSEFLQTYSWRQLAEATIAQYRRCLGH